MNAETLYGRPGDEEFHRDERDVWEIWWDTGSEGDDDTTQIEEWSTRGWPVESGDDIACRVAEYACDDMSDCRGVDDMLKAAEHPEVIAAFQAARDLLVAKAGSGWLFCDRLLRTGTMSTGGTPEKPEPVIDWATS